MATRFPTASIAVRVFLQGRYGYLLTSLLLLILLSPFLTDHRVRGGVLDVLICLVMLAGIYAATRQRRSLIVALVLVATTLATHVVGDYTYHFAFSIAHYSITTMLLIYVTSSVLIEIVTEPKVTLETIKGAIVVYLLLGLTWVFLFALVDCCQPGSFRFPIEPESHQAGHLLVREMFPRMMYFSYATLTTLGYGDIVPLSLPAQTITYLEAIAGQIYLAVLVARLVGLHISQSLGGDDH